MESLAALGLAANVLQFVQLAAGLLNSTRTIYNSASGVSEEAEGLEEIYTKLSQISQDIKTGIEGGEGVTRLSAGRTNLGTIAGQCKIECDHLVDIVGKLKVKESSKHRFWNSLRSALGEFMKRDEIAKMKERIDSYEKTMVLELCAISSENTAILSDQLRRIQLENAEWRTSRADQLSSLEQSYRQITTTTALVKNDKNPPSALSPEKFAHLTTHLRRVMLETREKEREHAILASLDYDYRPVRHRRIPEAHRSTFEWIYSDIPTRPSPGKDSVVSFESWLERGHGYFWITGKPGSGKSTLMKFVADHSKTRDSLDKWAAPGKAIIASHYFWSSGTLMQQSQEGLFRSIVRDVLSSAPDLIPFLCCDRWALDNLSGLREQPWEVSQLRSIVEALGSREDLPIRAKYCFFIDGLDEFKGDYEGDCQDICTRLLELSGSSRIKLCISSRPWNVFQHSFGRDSCRQLSVHRLTQDDIRTYACDRLQEHPRWLTFAMTESLPTHS
ncbi:hypothetical protein EDB81DRAFT_150316 [Dactylonectria macrodidyma]|uniref:Nephrocystin 3-like N-terminal domain-containing protein n=1 Tax=Dactylonectria macrodidyma TaxID=307937 RepID=A0A9P9FN26_9HYPO|nr:hypothetical protein EDB81DRAFT_150316 [Dactylonectria macrodidyma]